MKYLLIDTCNLKGELIGKESYSKSLEIFKDIIENQYYQLIVPDKLMEEWDKHKTVEKDKIEKSLKQTIKNYCAFETLEITDESTFQNNYNSGFKKLIKQIEIIEGIFNNDSYSIKTHTSDSVRANSSRCYDQTIPPFTKKGKDSFNDAYIIFSALEFMSKRNEDELIFISNNTNDFAESNGVDYSLHSKILELYPNTKVKYFSKFLDFIKDQIKEEYLPFDKFESNSSFEFDSAYEQIDLVNGNTELPIYDRFNEIFEVLYKELRYIPKHIFIKYLPLASNNENSYYNRFTLTISNPDLIQLFETFEFDDESNINIVSKEYFKSNEDAIKKITDILSIFRRNLFFYISSKGNKNTDIRFSKNTETCQCSKCKLQRLEFENLNFQDKLPDQTKLNWLLTNAYTNYTLKNYKLSIELYCDALKEIIFKNENITKAIIIHNLQKIRLLLIRTYSFENYNKIDNSIKKYDLREYFCSLTNTFEIENIKWLINDTFISRARINLYKIRGLLTQNYFSSLKGGTSSHYYVEELLHSYLDIYFYVQQNQIIYDCFDEFYEITEAFVEGYLASLMTVGYSSRIDSINCWYLKVIVNHTKERDLKKIIKKYKVKNITHTNLGDYTEYSLKLIDTFEEHLEFKSSFKEDETYISYKNSIIEKINNIILIASIMNFQKEYQVKLLKKILDFTKTHPRVIDFEVFDDFLLSIKDFIRKIDFIKAITVPILNNENLLTDYYWNLMIISKNTKWKIKLPRNVFNKLLENISSGGGEQYETIFLTKIITDAAQLKEIDNKIKEHVQQDNDIRSFLRFSIYDLYFPTSSEIEKVLTKITPKKTRTNPVNLFGKEIQYDSILSDFINICLKFEYSFKNAAFNNLYNRTSEYYKWLLTIDTFDYSKFNPEWIIEDNSKYFHEYYYNSLPLKESLEYHIKKREIELLARVEEEYINIYIRKNWMNPIE